MTKIIEYMKTHITNVSSVLLISISYWLAFKTYKYYEILEHKMKKLETTNELMRKQIDTTSITVHELSDSVINNLLKINNSINNLDPNVFLVKQNDFILNTLNKSNTPIINIITENNSNKTIIIGLCLLLIGGTALALYWYVPAVAVFTKQQFISLSYFTSEIINKIPGSNSAEGVCYLPAYKIQLLTTVKSGHSTHKVIDILTQQEYTLTDFLATKLIPLTTSIVEKTSHVVNGLDISSIL